MKFKSQLHQEPDQKWYFVVWTLAATGVRIRELMQFRAEHIYDGQLDIRSKGNKISYPIPYNTTPTAVKSAKEYYTAYAKCNIKGNAFSLPVWQVAVNEERRKEFGTEWCLRPDLQKSGYLAEHIAVNYPKYKNQGFDDPWSNREYEYDDRKNDMPIPADEIEKNPLCEQNDAYK